jgi:hypothetical protein
MDNHMLLELKDLEVVYQTDFENVYAFEQGYPILKCRRDTGIGW